MAIRQVEAALIIVCMWTEGWTDHMMKVTGTLRDKKKLKLILSSEKQSQPKNH
jgi:hypothetical protein